MVVVRPDQIVGPDQGSEEPGERTVHPEVARHVLAGELGQIEPVVAERPERAVGVARVVLVDILLGQIGDRIGDLAVVSNLEPLDLALTTGLSRPAEPETASFLERRIERNRQATGTRRSALGGWDRNAVRDNHKPRQKSALPGRQHLSLSLALF